MPLASKSKRRSPPDMASDVDKVLEPAFRKRLEALSASGHDVDALLARWPLDESAQQQLSDSLAKAHHLIAQTVDMALESDSASHPDVLKMHADWVERFERMGALILERGKELADESKELTKKNHAAQAYLGTGQL